MSVAQVTTEGSPDTRGLGRHLKPCWCQRIVLSLGPCVSERPKLPPRAIVTSTPKMLLLAVSGSMILLGSVLVAVVRVTTGTMSFRSIRALLSWSRPSLAQGELTLSLSGPGIMYLYTWERWLHPSPQEWKSCYCPSPEVRTPRDPTQQSPGYPSKALSWHSPISSTL